MALFYFYKYIVCFYLLYSKFSVVQSQIYPVEESKIYTWGNSFPQSCECQENGATDTSCSYFQCTCICDLTAGICDYGCCCDPDCSNDQISRFESLSVCQRDGTERNNVQFCYSSTELAKINPKTPLSDDSSTERGLNEALCVFKRNAIFRSEYYTNTDIQSSSVFSTSNGQKEYDYIEVPPTPIVREPYYDQNTTITAYYDVYGDDNTLISYGSGYWQIPRKDFSGRCNDFNLVEFEVDVALNSNDGCMRDIPISSSEFTQQCVGVWSTNYYVSRLKLARTASTLFSTVTNVQNVSISVSSVTHRDFATGESMALDLSFWNTTTCGTAALPSDFITQSSFENDCGYSISDDLVALLSSSATVCRSAIQQISYTVIHDDSAAGDILSVSAAIVITDIPLPTIDAGNQFRQGMEVAFLSNTSATRSQSDGNLVNRKRSGNPGYIVGRPVLFGYGYANSSLSSSPIAVAEVEEGLSMASPFLSFDINDPSSFGKSLCPSSSQLSLVEITPVKFGYDITTGCILQLNRSELNDLCCQGTTCTAPSASSYSHPSTGIPYFFNFTPGYVGIYGNSDPLDINQWLSISLSTSSASRDWVDKNSICYNMFTGMNYQFLVAKSGEKAFPQNKIVAASVEITSSNWIYRYPEPASSQKQSFPLTITATFIYTNAEDLRGYVPPPPPVLFRVPYDVFYPFQSNDGSSSTLSTSNLLIAIVCSVLVSSSLYFI